MELDDHEFDAAFRKRMVDTEPQFEEAAWNKMERKLRKRDRVVLFRKGALVALLAFAMAWIGYDFFDQGMVEMSKTELAHQGGTKPKGQQDTKSVSEKQDVKVAKTQAAKAGVQRGIKAFISSDSTEGIPGFAILKRNSSPGVSANSGLPDRLAVLQNVRSFDEELALASSGSHPAGLIPKTKKGVKRKPVPMSMALSVAPEFNSTTAMLGGQTGINVGLAFSMGVAAHLKVQTGLMYSRKDYTTDNYSYKFRNPKIQQMVAGIDASCAVLEIPVMASYTVMENHKRSVDLNLGMSSYLMLREDYTFRYTPESGIANRLVAKENANQHFLSVVAISATYFMKLKTEKFKIGVEPFLKIPLTGVGEGQVNLKSSGVSLKISYDLHK